MWQMSQKQHDYLTKCEQSLILQKQCAIIIVRHKKRGLIMVRKVVKRVVFWTVVALYATTLFLATFTVVAGLPLWAIAAKLAVLMEKIDVKM